MDDAGRRRKQRRERGSYSKFDPIGNLMNSEAILGIIRHVLTTAGGALVANGTLDANQLNTGAGALVVLIGVVWSVVAKKKAAAK
jgi:hypothetical protein